MGDIFEIKHFTSLFKHTPTCIYEVGSRDALQSVEFNEAFPGADIFAFEPNWATLPDCIRNTRGKADIRVVPMAVWDKNGVHEFYRSTTANQGYSSLHKPSGKYDHVEPMPFELGYVPTIRLDTFIELFKAPPPDTMWIDAQGSDLAVLRSLGNFISSVRAIWIEVIYQRMYENQCFRNDIVEFATHHGFELAFENVAQQDQAGINWWGDVCLLR